MKTLRKLFGIVGVVVATTLWISVPAQVNAQVDAEGIALDALPVVPVLPKIPPGEFSPSVLASSAIASQSTFASLASTPAAGADVNASNGAGLSEVSIDVNPTNPLNQVVVGHAPNLATMNTFYTTDGGATWTLVALGNAQDGLTSTFRFDPTVAFDDDGRLYVGYGVKVATPDRRAVVVATSTDGGQTYSQFTVISTTNDIGGLPGNDKWHLATGPDPVTPAQQNVYIAWTQNVTESGTDQRIVVSRSTDGGTTFSAPLIINDASIAGTSAGNLFADPAVGPNGEVYVSWSSLNANLTRVDRSLDGGLTWGTDSQVTAVNVPFALSIPPQPDRGISPGPTLDTDRSGGPNDGRLYITYTDRAASGGADTNIFVRSSTNGGATWSAPIRVNDDTGTSSQFLPWLDVDQVTGTVGVVWYDARNDASNKKVQTFMAASFDGGASFQANIQVADGQSDNSVDNASRYGGNFLEYIGIAMVDCAASMVWADNSTNLAVLDYFTDQVQVPNCGNQPPVLTVPGPQTVDFSDFLSFNVSATDADTADTLAFSATGLPAGLTLTDNGDLTATVAGTISAHPAVFSATITVDDGVNPSVSAVVQITVTQEETAILQTGTFTQDYNDPYTASATLTDPDGGGPIAGKQITFTLGGGGGTNACNATTNASGVASCSITPTQAAGTVLLIAAFGPDTDYLSATDSHSFVITREETTTTYTGPLVVGNGLPVTLSGLLEEDGVTPISGRTLTLSVGGNSCTAGPTDGSGNASCTIPTVSVPLGPVTVTADFAGDGFYLPSSQSKSAIVFAFPARGAFVLGDATVAAATPTTRVTFWGAQWSSLNALTGGVARSAFKGFASTLGATPPACGGGWTAAPGDSSEPVAGPLPAYMGVLVSSAVSQGRSTISGNVTKIVVVMPNAGYDTSPGHPGTGQVVATYCP